jgi:hypothetical protein
MTESGTVTSKLIGSTSNEKIMVFFKLTKNFLASGVAAVKISLKCRNPTKGLLPPRFKNGPPALLGLKSKKTKTIDHIMGKTMKKQAYATTGTNTIITNLLFSEPSFLGPPKLSNMVFLHHT